MSKKEKDKEKNKKEPEKKEKIKKAKEEPTDVISIDPKKAFKLVSDQVDKDFNNAFHAWAYEEEKIIQRRFSSGSIGADVALGGYGLPHGRIIELWGPSQSGKTSLALDIAWHLQKQTGLAVVFFDLEHKFDKTLFWRWRGEGFDREMTKYEEPFTGEDFFSMLSRYVESEATGIIIVDSVSGIKSAAKLESDDQTTHYGAQANLIAQYLPKISGSAARTGVPMIFINQVRANMEAHRMAKKKIKILRKGGGFAFDHWIAISLFVDRSTIITDGTRDLGHWSVVHVYKNNSGDTLFKSFKSKLYYGWGYDTSAELAAHAIGLGIFPKTSEKGHHYIIDGNTLNGEEAVAEFLKGRPDLCPGIIEDIRAMHLSGRKDTVDKYISQLSWESTGNEGILIMDEEEDYSDE